MFESTRMIALAFVVGLAAIGCSGGATDRAATESAPTDQTVTSKTPPQQPTPAAVTPASTPARLNLPAAPDPETMTPEERLANYPILQQFTPDPNFREVLSPLIRDQKVLYSQFYEELVIRDFFQDQENGVFLDVGCYHPIRINTTYYLEHHLGWSGVAVDAIAEHANAWKKERPRSKFLAYAITDHDGDTITFYAHGGTSSIDKKASELFGGQSQPIQVPTITLTSLLDREGLKTIDFLSIDIEGAEPGALKGFDIKRFKPRLVCVEKEVGVEPSEKNAFLMEYFEAGGYERIDKYLAIDKLNWYFTPKSSS